MRGYVSQNYHPPVISICDDSYDMIANNNDFSWKHRLVRKIVTPLLDNLILVEPNVKDWYQKHYHKGIWFPIIRDDDKARIAYKRVLGKSQQLVEKYKLAGKHVFLFVGRLVALKNVKTIIEAFRRLNQESNVLVIIGSGEEKATLRALSADSGWGNVIFTGRLEGDELYSWYNVATSFILGKSSRFTKDDRFPCSCWNLTIFLIRCKLIGYCTFLYKLYFQSMNSVLPQKENFNLWASFS